MKTNPIPLSKQKESWYLFNLSTGPIFEQWEHNYWFGKSSKSISEFDIDRDPIQ